MLKWCTRFQLQCECTVRQRSLRFAPGPGDPILPSATPRLHESKLEERFAREFRKVAPAFYLTREPEPVRAGQKLIFPDFAIRRRADPSDR